MKKYISVALVLVLCLAALTGCRSKTTDNTSTPSTVAPTTQMTTAPTTQPTTATTQPSTTMTEPSMEELIPGTDDTIDPTNGANQDSAGKSARGSAPKY